jgi:hypothetical protein
MVDIDGGDGVGMTGGHDLSEAELGHPGGVDELAGALRGDHLRDTGGEAVERPGARSLHTL